MEHISLILAGGRGARLWPLSRENRPKQFIELCSRVTLVEDTYERLRPTLGDRQWIITSKDMEDYFKLYVSEYPDWKKSHNTKLLLEPESKNTMASILYGLLKIKDVYGDDIAVVISPSDQLVKDDVLFNKTISEAIEMAKACNIVLIGVEATYPEDGYGYIKVQDSKVVKYTEKPSIEQAGQLIAEGDYYFNTGIYVVHLKTILDQIQSVAPEIWYEFEAVDINDDDAIQKLYTNIDEISVNEAFIKNLDSPCFCELKSDWSAVNSWKRFFDISEKDEANNVIVGEGECFNTQNSLVYSEDKFISLVDVSNIGVVSIDDAVIVCNLDSSDQVKDFVQRMKNMESRHINYNNVGVRPWGSYFVLEEGIGYKIKRIKVDPGQQLSLQMHYHRSEHWIVVKGIAQIVNGEKEFYVHENESTYIPATTKHRLSNPGVLPLEIIEVQCGSYLEEDDIVRYEDIYDRK